MLGLSSDAGVSPIELITTLRKEGYASAAERLTTLFPTIISFIEFPPAGQRLVARSHFDRTAQAFNETAGVLFDRYTAMEGAGHDPCSFPPWFTRLAWYVLTCRMGEVLSSPESTAEDLHRLAEAFSTWGVGIPRRCSLVIGTLHHPADGGLGETRETVAGWKRWQTSSP